MSNFLSNIRITERVNGEVNPRVDVRVMKVMRPHAGSVHTMILILATTQDLFLRLYLTVEPLSTSSSISAQSSARMLTKDQFVQGLEPLRCGIYLDDYSTE